MGRAFEPDIVMEEWVADVERLDRDDSQFLLANLSPRSTNSTIAAFWRRMEEPEFVVVAYETLRWARIRTYEHLGDYPTDSLDDRRKRSQIHAYIDRLDGALAHLKPMRSIEVSRRNEEAQRDLALERRREEGYEADHQCPWFRRFMDLKRAVDHHEERGGGVANDAVLYQTTEELHQEGKTNPHAQ